MLNGLYILRTLSSPEDSKRFPQQSVNQPIQTHTSTKMVVSNIVATAALGQTDRSQAAIQSMPLGALTTTNRQGGWNVLLKDTIMETDRVGI